MEDAVLPLDPPARSAWPTTPMEPVNDGAPLHEDLWVRRLELVESEAGSFVRASGYVARSRTASGIVTWEYEPAATCFTLSGALLEPVDGEADCPTAMGGVVHADGTYASVAPPDGADVSAPFLTEDGEPVTITRARDP